MTDFFEEYEFPRSVPLEVEQVLRQATQLYSPAEVDAEVDRLAVRLTVALQHRNPVLINVAHGGTVLFGMLLRRLVFPLQTGFVHVSRYRDATSGGELDWHARSYPELKDRCVVLIDDILDEGRTLAAVNEAFAVEEPEEILNVVLVNRTGLERAIEADLKAFDIAPGFLIGCGMDFKGYGRNLPGLYVLSEEGSA